MDGNAEQQGIEDWYDEQGEHGADGKPERNHGRHSVEQGVSGNDEPLIDPDIATDWSQLLYFSLTSLTTLGYGDITPLSPVARVWSTLEAVTGVLYIAILVARPTGYRDPRLWP